LPEVSGGGESEVARRSSGRAVFGLLAHSQIGHSPPQFVNRYEILLIGGRKALDAFLDTKKIAPKRIFLMALPSFVESAPRAYRLKAGNAALPISTLPGTFPVAAAATDETFGAFTIARSC
jgi:hypothetical protein